MLSVPTRLVTALMLAVGCASAPKPKPVPSCKVPEEAQLEIESSDRVNLDESGRSLPTVLRVYQLSELGKIQQATFEDVWVDPKQALGETLLGGEELTLYPGQLAVHRFKRNPAADFLVGVAVFRMPVGEAWRTIQEWPLPGDPCGETKRKDTAPKLERLRVRMFLSDYRIESVNNYAAYPKRRCPGGVSDCAGAAAPSELPRAKRNQRLRTFEEDPSEARPTMNSKNAGGVP
jgi:type VI secretion system protein VasD